MNDRSFSYIDSLLLQFAIQTRELSQKKNEINQQIQVRRADIAERRSYIEAIHRNINNLEEEIRAKQSTVALNKANAKSMKATNGLLLQYEQTLKAELESRGASYKQDKEVYEERIASYRKIFHSHKEYYCQNPLAQKLLGLQAEKEEIECRIKACDDQITMKHTELEHLTGLAVSSSSSEKQPDSVSGQQPTKEPEKHLDPQTEEESDTAIDISSLHLNQSGHTVSVEANAGDIHAENKVQDTSTCSLYPKEASSELWSYGQVEEQSCPDEMRMDTQEEEMDLQERVLEQQSSVSEVEEAVEDKVEERAGADEDQTPSEEDKEVLAAFPQSSSPGSNPQSSPAKITAAPSTPTFPFNFSPTRSPYQGTFDTKSPAFLFSLNSDTSSPGFSGFGFDVGTSQDEGTSFVFNSSFFNKKKTTEPKSPGCPEFLFDQSEQSEDFQFAFPSKSPQATNEDKTRDDFPFSFNF